MTTPSGPDGRDMITITRDQAMDPHVDDLLRRQASLRGEGGITRSPKGKWYRHNWFIFMIAGALAAFAAWALLEPHFDDTLYVQGPIAQISTALARPPIDSPGMEQLEFKVDLQGPIRVNGEDVYAMPGRTQFLHADGRKEPADLALLKQGQVIGLHVDRIAAAQTEVNIAAFIVPDPPPEAPKKAAMTLEAQAAQTNAAGMLLFAVVAAMIGLAIGAADGIGCHLLRRALLAGFVGMIAGFIGGFVSGIVAGLAYTPLNNLAMQQEGDAAGGLTTFGFVVQMSGRSLAWALAGMAMGLGQGIALRSGRLILYGFLGGVIGGLVGGLLFDPVCLLQGWDVPSAHWSRLAGIVAVGACVGLMIGVVELLARDAWLRMLQGPLAGKEFLLFKDTMHLGASPRSEIYLFNDETVAPQHAVIRSVGSNYEIENLSREEPLRVNGTPVTRTRLRHGDQIAIGRTVFAFNRRKD